MLRKFVVALLAPLFAVALPLLSPGAAAQPAQALPDFADLAERVGPAVVGIRTTARIGTGPQGGPSMPDLDENDPMYEFFRRFFPNPPQQGPQGPRQQQPGPRRNVPRGLGSGFIVSVDGYLLTNAHVVDGADEITVTLHDKREFKAKLLGADKRTDVAVLKIEATGLPSVRIGDSARLRVGEWRRASTCRSSRPTWP
jgi:serine protease Do